VEGYDPKSVTVGFAIFFLWTCGLDSDIVIWFLIENTSITETEDRGSMFSCTFYFETATIHSRSVLYINLFYNFVSISKIKNI
jgi:hypothetical protein